jgi:electron transport complex protein RnfC
VGESLTLTHSESAPASLAPVAGRIIGVARGITLTNGAGVDAIELETAATSLPPPPAPTEPAPRIRLSEFTYWIDRLLRAGVGANRCGSPDLIGQLVQCLSRPIDTVMCCALESDPNVPLNLSVARSNPSDLGAGIDLLAKLTGARRVWLVAQPSSELNDWFNKLNPLVRADGLQLAPLGGDYPQSHPTLLLHTLLDRRLRPNRLPVEQGVLLLDAPAAVAIGRCARDDRPMLDVPLAVRDHVARKTHLLTVAIGTSMRDVCRFLEIPGDEVLIRSGDFLRDQQQSADAVIGPGELTLHITAPELPEVPDPCLRCGWCIDACPTNIHPAGIVEAAQRDDPGMAEHYGVDACIECGICSYVCPSRLPLLRAIRTLRGTPPVTSPPRAESL